MALLLRRFVASSLRRSAYLGICAIALLSGGCLVPTAPRGVMAWVVSGEEELTYDTPANLENEVFSATRGRVQLDAALNETVAVQLGLRATGVPAGPFDVQVGPLVGDHGRLPGEAVQIARVHYTRVERFHSWYPAHTGRPATPRLFPDILVPWDAPRGGGPVLLTEPRNEIVWIEFHVPATIAAGKYRGQLEVGGPPPSGPVLVCDVELDVWPVALPGRRSLPVLCRVDPRDLLAAHLRWPREAAEETRLLPSVPAHLAAVRLAHEAVRLFQAHRTNPVLWASFPKFHPVAEGAIEGQWAEYDALVEPWLDGSAFADNVRLEFWPLPISDKYPDPQRDGGPGSERYARLFAACLAECQRHFAERGWLDRAFLRPVAPEPLTQSAVDRVRRLAEIRSSTGPAVPLVAHLPGRSPRGLGWYQAPSTDLPDVSIWAPPAMWCEPDVLAQERHRGRQTWWMPDIPPYSGSLAPEAGVTDARILPWQAYRYGVGGLWIEHAAEFDPAAGADTPWAVPGLVYPAEAYGLRDRPLPSLRLKRLLRGLQDYELLRLLEDNGKRLLAQNLAAQVVRWAGTDACDDSLLNTKDAGWPRDAAILRLARKLMLQELAGEFEPNPQVRQRQLENLAQWGLLMTQARHVVPTVDGLRLQLTETGLRAQVVGSLLNATNRPVRGRWTLPTPPPGWQLTAEVISQLEPGTRRPVSIELQMTGFAYNIDGIYPFEMAFDTDAFGTFRVPARLAVAVCPPLPSAPTIDGRLSDWPLASNNAAADFRLCRRPGVEPRLRDDRPTMPTQAFFALDSQNLYVAVRCALTPGEPPVWQADNVIPLEGAQPWGQDVIEVLIDPRTTPATTSSDLYCLQAKPNGLLIARRGCQTEPPIGASQPWQAGARAAVSIQPDAWVIELAMPLTAFDAPARTSRVWGVNIARLDARRGEYSSWSGARGHCYNPASLGNLIVLWP